MKNISFILIFLFLSLAYVGLYYYNAYFFSKYFNFNYKYSKLFFLLLALFSIVSLFLRRNFSNIFVEYFSFLSYICMGSVFIFSFYFFICDMVLFMSKNNNYAFISIIFLSLAILSIIKSIYNAFYMPDIKNINIPYNFSDIKIALISDIHIDYEFKKKLFFKSFNKILSEKPDIIVFLGDLVDPGFKIDKNEKNFFQKLNIPCIGVLGNHEYYYGFDKSKEIYNKLNIKLLLNSSYSIKEINFIGFRDIRTENISKEEAIEILENNYEQGKLNIILSHQPLYFKELAQKKDIIMFSGHIHKGQIFPFSLFVRLFYKYFYGLYKENNSYLYVTSGLGTWGPFMRFMADSEIPIVIIGGKV